MINSQNSQLDLILVSSYINKANILEYLRTNKEFLAELYNNDYLIKRNEFSLKLLEFNQLGYNEFSAKVEATYYWADIYRIDGYKIYDGKIAKIGFENLAILVCLCKDYLKNTDNVVAEIFKRKKIFDIKKDKDGIKIEYQARDFYNENELERKLTKYNEKLENVEYNI